MPLALRILALILALNLVVVGGVQAALYAFQRSWIREQQGQNLAAALVPYLLSVYTAERLGDDTQVRTLVQSPIIRDYFADVAVTSGRPPLSGLVYLNPRGAVDRDPDRFAMSAVLDGMQQARLQDGLVAAAGGYATAIRTKDGIAGYLWFVPRLDVAPPSLPWRFLIVAVVVGSSLFGLALHLVFARSIRLPLQRVGSAAERVGAGAYEVRVPELGGVPELDGLVRSFNAMAQRVQDHTQDLQAAVAEAVLEAKRSERALVQSSRLASVGTLAAGIAHEINNPIGGMLNAVVRLQADPSLGERQRAYLQLLQDGLQRIARTARKVLDFSPKQAVAQPFSLAGCIERARSLCEHRLSQSGATLRLSLPAGLPPCFGDPHEIAQVLLNLLLNSLDAFEQQGKAGTIEVGAEAEPGMVRLSVRDDGPGMARQDLPRVMDPFFTQKQRPDASGLGMFISYSIIHNHGGTMTVDSEVGAGFQVEIRLPRAPGPEPEPAAVE